ncbi:hypothetical protein HK101_011417, partial [Irineochytrium annulatum]
MKEEIENSARRGAPKVNIEGPGSRALALLRDLQQSHRSKRLSPAEIERILEALLSGGDAYVPSLTDVTNANNTPMDEEVKSWVLNTVLAAQATPTLTHTTYTASHPHPHTTTHTHHTHTNTHLHHNSNAFQAHRGSMAPSIAAASVRAANRNSVGSTGRARNASDPSLQLTRTRVYRVERNEPERNEKGSPLVTPHSVASRRRRSSYTSGAMQADQPTLGLPSLPPLPASPASSAVSHTSAAGIAPSTGIMAAGLRQLRTHNVGRRQSSAVADTPPPPPLPPFTARIPDALASAEAKAEQDRKEGTSQSRTAAAVACLSSPTYLEQIDGWSILNYLDLWFPSWNIDMFDLCEKTGGHPLYFAGLWMLEQNELFPSFMVDRDKFLGWLLMMESEYRSHPYHNAIHAADVLHAFNFLLLNTAFDLSNRMSAAEKFAAIIAAIGHDLDHPGYNNQFMVKSHHPIAVMYSDISVNELHHSAHFFQMSLNSPFNIFSGMTNDEYDDIRRLVIRLILCTDMGKHFEYVTKFKTKMSTVGFGRLEHQESRIAIVEIALKCADLNNPSKMAEISDRWCESVMEEFYRQGDMERELGFSVSQFMDRHNPNVPKCQVGFIDFLVSPLYDAWTIFNQNNDRCSRIQKGILKNRMKWAAMILEHQPTATVHNHTATLTAGGAHALSMAFPQQTHGGAGEMLSMSTSAGNVVATPSPVPPLPGPLPLSSVAGQATPAASGSGIKRSLSSAGMSLRKIMIEQAATQMGSNSGGGT